MHALHPTNQWHFTSVSYPIVKSVVIGSRRYVIIKITNKKYIKILISKDAGQWYKQLRWAQVMERKNKKKTKKKSKL